MMQANTVALDLNFSMKLSKTYLQRTSLRRRLTSICMGCYTPMQTHQLQQRVMALLRLLGHAFVAHHLAAQNLVARCRCLTRRHAFLYTLRRSSALYLA
jgi:ATP-dependent Zn protease